MFTADQIATYVKSLIESVKVQVSAAITFGTVLALVWFNNEGNELKIFLTVLFLFPLTILVYSLIEKVLLTIKTSAKKKKDWVNLTPEELNFIESYIKRNSKVRYVTVYNGTYRDSGIIQLLTEKNIIYRASSMSEFRGEDWMSREQQFPFNIHDEAFTFFKLKFEKKT